MGIQPDFMPRGYVLEANSDIQKPVGLAQLQVEKLTLLGMAIKQLFLPREASRPDTQGYE